MSLEPVASIEDQVAELARRYSTRADCYDRVWSPIIQPLGERLLDRLPLTAAANVIDVGTGAGVLLPAIQRAAPMATVLGVDNAEGMLELARRRHPGPLVLMDAQKLELPDSQFDVAVIAFVLFHLPRPDRCLDEVCRVLKPGGFVGTATWAYEQSPAVSAVWDEELTLAGAPTFSLPGIDSTACCDSEERTAALLERSGFRVVATWVAPVEHQWSAADHFALQERYTPRLRLESLAPRERRRVLERIRCRLAGARPSDYVFKGQVVLAMAEKPSG